MSDRVRPGLVDGVSPPILSASGGDGLTSEGAYAKLQIWLSPSFPVGAFAYSHGLEKAVENGTKYAPVSRTATTSPRAVSGSRQL